MIISKVDITGPEPFTVGKIKYVKVLKIDIKHSEGTTVVRGELRVKRPGKIALDVFVDDVQVSSVPIVEDFETLKLVEHCDE